MKSDSLDRLRGHPVFAQLRAVARRAEGAVYLVGGALRDAQLDHGPLVDWDLAVAAKPRRFSEALARRLGGTCFMLHEATQIYRIAVKPRGERAALQIDVARLQGRSIQEDLARRDFTMNAMALRLSATGGPLLDPHGGRRDLRRRRLRAVSELAFGEDPLRMLRAFRLAAQFGLTIEPATLRALRARRRLLMRSAAERIRAELMNLLAAPASAAWLRLLDRTGLLTVLFPELEAGRRCAEVYYGKGGVLKHTLNVVERMDFLLANLERVYPALAGPIRAHAAAFPGGPAAYSALLRLGALLHDVAKPATAKRIKGRLRFFGHEGRGAAMADGMLERMRFSREERALLRPLIAHHLRPGNLAANRVVSDKAVFRFFRDLGVHGIGLLLLCWADHASYLSAPALGRVLKFVREDPHTFPPSRVRSPATRKTLYHLQVISFLLDRYFSRPDTVRPKQLLDGHAVMKALNMRPGPKVGEILRLVEEAQAEGRLLSKADALRWISRKF